MRPQTQEKLEKCVSSIGRKAHQNGNRITHREIKDICAKEKTNRTIGYIMVSLNYFTKSGNYLRFCKPLTPNTVYEINEVIIEMNKGYQIKSTYKKTFNPTIKPIEFNEASQLVSKLRAMGYEVVAKKIIEL